MSLSLFAFLLIAKRRSHSWVQDLRQMQLSSLKLLVINPRRNYEKSPEIAEFNFSISYW